MKAATIFRLAPGLFIRSFLLFFLVVTSPAQAQDGDSLDPSEEYRREELAQMLAPIALYPDALLAQVLMAATYPIEVIEADRWVRMSPELKDEVLDYTLQDKDWDPSVKAICHFPSILALMSERIGETTNLGNAFLAQEEDVMGVVQQLRAKAYAQDNLTTTAEQTVIVEGETIIIEPADSRIIYVPYYDPHTIYGPWWYPAYPPHYYWGPPRARLGYGISYWPGFSFGFSFGSWSYFDWHHHYVHIDVHKRPRYVRHDRWTANHGRWHHVPKHRRGVAYRDKYTARKYGQGPGHAHEFRRETRGFPERQLLERDRRGEVRTTTGRDPRVREPVVHERTLRGRTDLDNQGRLRGEWDRQLRIRAKQIDRNRPAPQRIERGKQQPGPQKPAKVKPDRQEREPAIQKQQGQLRGDPAQQIRARQESARGEIGRLEQQRRRDNVFNRVDDGRRERLTGERGRVSRQGRIGDSRVRGGSGADGSDGRGRNWRDR
ncbi:DUF3300 domain-containing protein [Trichloromonas sp.]|uniref:DUF3300 domain-containing protein n=1 Tax=Trichloromonas sp. TaxID=3069249 RepID=UPI003D814990